MTFACARIDGKRLRLRDGRPSCALGLSAMLKKSRRTDYQRNLARPITLADGTQLLTFRDAANVLLDVVNARSGGLDHAIGSLLTAAQTGERADIAEATDAIEPVLRAGSCCDPQAHADAYGRTIGADARRRQSLMAAMRA